MATFKRSPVNKDQEVLPIEVIEQPDWVRNMEENEKHYRKSKNHFLKNVVYKNSKSGQIVVVTLTGDLEVNKTKLEQAIKAVGQLEDATEEDLQKMGTKPGYVHSWGYESVFTVADIVLLEARNLIGGQKTETTDTINVNYGRDFACDMVADVAMAYPGARAMDGGIYVEKKGIEVGNIFQLGYHYSNLMKGAVYTDVDGEEKPYYMGCYGIGIGRTMAAVVEMYNDERGIVWPESIAPFKVHLIYVSGKDESVKQKADQIYRELLEAGIEVLYDDRDGVGAGEKFADSDLIGIPYRVVISSRSLEKESVEIKKRNDSDAILEPLTTVVSYFMNS